MQVILLQRIGRLGQMGDIVNVKDGYARNFLLPQKKALRATDENRKHFESQRAQLEANNLELKKEAEAVAEKLDNKVFVAIRSAGDTGQLYGSVSARDIAAAVTEAGFTIQRSQVVMERPVKSLGLFDLRVRLHPEVSATITANVARSEDEAAEQARLGHAILTAGAEETDEERARAEAEAMFEPEAAERIRAETEEAEQQAAAESEEK